MLPFLFLPLLPALVGAPSLSPGYATTNFDSGMPSPGFSWRACVNERWGHTTFPFDEKLRVREECTPDTLYTWRSPESVQRLLAQARLGSSLLPEGHRIYLWRTPIGSYGYGSVALRVKLRVDATFVPVILAKPEENGTITEQRECANLEQRFGRPPRAVYAVRLADYGYFPSRERMFYHEYILCSGEAVASISAGTPEFLAEMERERAWMEEHGSSVEILPGDRSYAEFAGKWKKAAELSLIREYDGLVRSAYFSPLWLHHRSGNRAQERFDRVDWKDLPARFAAQEALARRGGEMYPAPASPAERKSHFRTKLPSYFNPFPQP